MSAVLDVIVITLLVVVFGLAAASLMFVIASGVAKMVPRRRGPEQADEPDEGPPTEG